MPGMPHKRTIRIVSILLAGMITWGCVTEARAEEAVDFSLRLRMSNRFNFRRNQLDFIGHSPFDLRFARDEMGYSVFLAAGADLSFYEAVSLHLTVDSGELKFKPLGMYDPELLAAVTANQRPIEDEAKNTGFLREAFLTTALGRDGWLSIAAGKMLVSTGNGFIMDNYALGVALSADFDLGYEVPLKVTLDGLLPNGDFSSQGKSSPLVYLDMAYLISFFEEIGLFVAWYQDNDGNLGEILRSTMLEAVLNGAVSGRIDDVIVEALLAAPISSSGNLFYVGLRGNKIFDNASISAIAMVEFGSFRYDIPLPDTPQLPDKLSGQPECLGGMLDVSLYFDVADDVTMGAFFMFLSGETFTSGQARSGINNYNSFISVYPYITRTNLFFSGGMNENFSARGFGTSGMNGRGVISPGITLGWNIVEDLTVRTVTAVLLSHGKHLSSGSRFYGVEADFNLEWKINRYLALLAEADFMYTGGFFDFEKPLGDPVGLVNEPNVWKVLIGLDIYY